VPDQFRSAAVRNYFKRFGLGARRIPEPPHSELEYIVVIPCFNEPALNLSLDCLWHCLRPPGAVEVIVVLNSSEDDAAPVIQQNEETLRAAKSWIAEHQDSRFCFHLLDCRNLPRKKAGVGLARKIGMDEALRRFDDLERLSGIILCFDADCACDPNYLSAIGEYFAGNPSSPGCSIYFEHPLEGSEDQRIYEAATLYELHLRYYIEGLRWAGFPYAYHTIGSSMAVRAETYCKQGGMNARQAGEDFYFLHKVIPLGGFGEVNATRVVPSPRPSDRVPFGTGRAVREFLETGAFRTYPLRAFDDLRSFFSAVPLFWEIASLQCMEASLSETITGPILNFLKAREIEPALKEIRANTSSPAAFEKRFFHWFNGFAVMKYIHFAESLYGGGDLPSCAGELLMRTNEKVRVVPCAKPLLMAYRDLQRFSPVASGR
jgi:glycosyltransferase involved in cell wall biosynthesis